MAKIALDIATEEVLGWLKYKKISETQIDSNDDSVEELAAAISEGVLKLDEKSKELKHTLKFPVGEEIKITELTYRPRLNDSIISPHMKGVKPNDADGRLNAYICALTGEARGIIRKLDTVDKKISLAIAVFFL